MPTIKSRWFFTTAALVTSIMALNIMLLTSELDYFVVEAGFPNRTSEAAHNFFHTLELSGFALAGALILLFVAWHSVRKADPMGIVVLAVCGAPAALVPIAGYAAYGPWHDYVFQPAALWAAAVLASAAGWLVKCRETARGHD